jgi:hypothetical protein
MDGPLRARWRERIDVGPYNTFVQRGRFAHDVYLLFGVLQKQMTRYAVRLGRCDTIKRVTLRMCTSVAGQITLILTSGLSSDGLSQPIIHAY